MKGLKQRRTQRRIGAEVDRVQALVDWSQEGQHHHLSSTWVGTLVAAELKDILLCISLAEELGLCFNCWTIVFWLLFLCSCIPLFPLRSLIKKTCSRASTVARLRSQNGLDQNGLRKLVLFLPGIPEPICLQRWSLVFSEQQWFFSIIWWLCFYPGTVRAGWFGCWTWPPGGEGRATGFPLPDSDQSNPLP